VAALGWWKGQPFQILAQILAVLPAEVCDDTLALVIALISAT